jgi:hypothetical protein
MRRWFERYGWWLGLIVFFVAYYRRFISQDDGIILYAQGAQCLLDNQILPKCALAFTYPPAFAFIMIPFAPLPLWLRLLLWYAVTIIAILGIYKFSERIAAKLFADSFSEKEMIWVRVISIALSLKFVLAVMENEAYDALPVLFIVLGLATLLKGRDALGGASLGFAAAIKATPLIFLPYLLIKKRFSAAAGFLIVLFAMSYAPDMLFTPTGVSEGYFHTWLRQVAGASFSIDPGTKTFAFWAGPNALNHSLRGAVSLQLDEIAHPILHESIVYGLDFAFIIFAAALITLRKQRRDLIAIDASILLIAALLLSPMTSRSHYVALVLPYVTLTMVMLRDQVRQRTGIVVLAISFFFLTMTSNDVVGKTISDWAYFHSFLVIGALTLMIYIAVIVWQPAVLSTAKPFDWRKTQLAKRLTGSLVRAPNEGGA